MVLLVLNWKKSIRRGNRSSLPARLEFLYPIWPAWKNPLLSISAAQQRNCERKIYRRGYKYQKAGVGLFDLSVPNQYRQLDLFGTLSVTDTKSSKLMSVMDQINSRMGRGTLKIASEGFNQPWKMKQGNKSPSYTTNWDELICVTK